MSGKRRSTERGSGPTASDLKKIDNYVLGPKDYEEIPELTDERFERADLYIGGKLIRRGRPKAEARKEPVSLRLDPDVVAHYRRTGPSWQSRINDTLRKAAKLPAKTTRATKAKPAATKLPALRKRKNA